MTKTKILTKNKTNNLNINAGNDSSKLRKIDFYHINNPKARELGNSINDTISFIDEVDNKKIGEAKFSLTDSRGNTVGDFTKYTRLRNFGTSVRDGRRTIDEAEDFLNNMEKDIIDFRKVNVRKERNEKRRGPKKCGKGL